MTCDHRWDMDGECHICRATLQDELVAQAAQIAALETEVERLKAEIDTYDDIMASQSRVVNDLRSNLAPFVALAKASKPALVFMAAMRGEDYHEVITLRDALAHPAVQRLLVNP